MGAHFQNRAGIHDAVMQSRSQLVKRHRTAHIAGGRDNRPAAGDPRDFRSQTVRAAEMPAQQADRIISALIADHHRRIAGLASAERRDMAHHNPRRHHHYKSAVFPPRIRQRFRGTSGWIDHAPLLRHHVRILFRNKHIRVFQSGGDLHSLGNRGGSHAEHSAFSLKHRRTGGGAAAVCKISVIQSGKPPLLLVQDIAHNDHRLALDSRRLHLFRNIRQRAAHDFLILPACAVDHGGRRRRDAPRGKQFLHELMHFSDTQKDAHRAIMGSERGQLLLFRHRRTPRVARHNHTHAEPRHRIFRLQRGGGGKRAAHAGNDVIRNAETVQFAVLLGNSSVHRRVSGMQAHHLFPRPEAGHQQFQDFFQRQLRAVHKFRMFRKFQQFFIHKRSGVNHKTRLFQRLRAAYGNQVGSSGTRTDECNLSAHFSPFFENTASVIGFSAL